MNVIRHSVDLNWNASDVLNNTSHVCIQGLFNFGMDHWCAVLGAPDRVEVHL